VRIEVQRLDPGLPVPAYAREGDAGLDLYAAESVTLPPGARVAVGTGIAVAIPPGCAGFVLPRSGLALRHGLSLVNTPGLIDAGYRGEIRVVLINHDREATVTLARGDRIAQLVIQRIETADLVEVDKLSPTTRGAGGFGSTGA
jgi:dUTP pyrophosphatase